MRWVLFAVAVLFVTSARSGSIWVVPAWDDYPNDVRQRALQMERPAPTKSTVDVRIHVASDVVASTETVALRLSLARRVLAQCGVDLRFTGPEFVDTSGVDVDVGRMSEIARAAKKARSGRGASEAVSGNDVIDVYVVRSIVRRADTGAVVRPIGKAFYSGGQAVPDLYRTVWISEFAFQFMDIPEAPRQPSQQSVLAHEIMHILCGCGDHVPSEKVDAQRGHLMVETGALPMASNALDAAACASAHRP